MDTAAIHLNKKPVRLKSIALPAEHGAWSLILEPLILGLLIIPSWLGVLFAFAIFFVFLTHQPVKIFLKDYRKGKFTPRTQWAIRFSLIYLVLGILFSLPVLLSPSENLFVAIVCILPFAIIQLYFDFDNKSRSWLAETSGAIALSGSVAVIAVVGGWSIQLAFILWLIIGLRAVISILFVRAFFRKQRNKVAPVRLTYSVHFLVLLLIIALAMRQIVPYLTIIPFLVLLLRTIYSLNNQQVVKAQIIGIREVIYGVGTVGFTALGFILNG